MSLDGVLGVNINVDILSLNSCFEIRATVCDWPRCRVRQCSNSFTYASKRKHRVYYEKVCLLFCKPLKICKIIYQSSHIWSHCFLFKCILNLERNKVPFRLYTYWFFFCSTSMTWPCSPWRPWTLTPCSDSFAAYRRSILAFCVWRRHLLKMASLKFYYDLMSQPSRAVYLFLKVNKIPFEPKPVAIRKGKWVSDCTTESVNGALRIHHLTADERAMAGEVHRRTRPDGLTHRNLISSTCQSKIVDHSYLTLFFI